MTADHAAAMLPLLGFIGLTVVVLLALIVSIVTESYFWCATAVVAYFAALHFLLGVTVDYAAALAWLQAHWVLVLVSGFAYALAGCGWAVVKWTTWIGKKARELEDRLRANPNGYTDRTPPQVHEMRGRIVRWMAFWPVSLIETAISDFLRELFMQLYNQIAGLLQRIADRAWARAQQRATIGREKQA
jgi:hypothetical protein